MKPALHLDVLWSPDALQGPCMAVLDVVRGLHALQHMRAPGGVPPVRWRWVAPAGVRAPGSGLWGEDLRTCYGFRGSAHLLVVPGWHASSGPHLDQLLDAAMVHAPRLRALRAQAGMLLCVGNAVALPARLGLLHDSEVVAPWPFVPMVLRQAEGVQLRTDVPWLHSQGVWSCDSPVWTTHLMLDALGFTPWADLATAAAHVLLHAPERQQVVTQIVQDTITRKVPPAAAEQARRWLQAHLTQPYDIQVLAQATATSVRTLLRHFEAVHGQTPLQYLQGLRMSRAQVLLQTTYLPVDQVALACGYADVSTFRRLFVKHSGTLPAAYREQYRLRTPRDRWAG